jgi:hypothetical protein
MSKLLDYLNLLDSDAAALAAFKANSTAEMTKAGLSKTEQDAVHSRDRKRVADLIGIAESDVPPIHTNGAF